MKKTSFLSIVALTTLGLSSPTLTMDKEKPANTQKEQPKDTQAECDIFAAIKKGDIKQAKEFVEKYENDEIKMNEIRAIKMDDWICNTDMTPLLYAIEAGQEEIANLLISAQATDINKTGYKDRTPLHQACAFKITSIVEILLARGAKADLKDDRGNTPMHETLDYNIKIKNKNLKEEELVRFIDVESVKIINLLLLSNSEARRIINEPNNSGITPFINSIRVSNLEAFNLFLKNGAEVNSRFKSNHYPLDFSLKNLKKINLENYYKYNTSTIEIFKQLLLNGATASFGNSAQSEDQERSFIFTTMMSYIDTMKKYQASKNKNQFISEKQKELEEKLKSPEKLSPEDKKHLFISFASTENKNTSRFSLIKESKKYIEIVKPVGSTWHRNNLLGFVALKWQLSAALTYGEEEDIRYLEQLCFSTRNGVEHASPVFNFIEKRSDLRDEAKIKQELEKNDADFMEFYKEAECRRFDFLVQLHKKNMIHLNMHNNTKYLDCRVFCES